MSADRDDDYPDVLPEDPRAEGIADLVAIGASVVPGLGGAVAAVLNNWSAERKRDRVRDVLDGLALRLANLKSQISEEYVRSDEFEDLLDQTLRRAATERNEAKRRIYAAFLAGAVTSPGEPYHEQLRFLRTLDELQPDHMRVIRAMLQEPPEPGRGTGGSPSQTLQRRLPDMASERVIDLAMQLTDELRIVTIGGRLKMMMSAAGAEAFALASRRMDSGW